MRIDYSKINWNAKTNWEFCGTKENLRMVWDRNWEYLGVRVPIEEFAYEKPRKGLAFARGDVVTYKKPGSNQAPKYATIVYPVSKDNGLLYIRFADGQEVEVHPADIPACIAIADIPEELVALARAEAGKPMNLLKCPLIKPACMRA